MATLDDFVTLAGSAPLAASAVQQWCNDHHRRLPDDFVTFLTTVGIGPFNHEDETAGIIRYPLLRVPSASGGGEELVELSTSLLPLTSRGGYALGCRVGLGPGSDHLIAFFADSGGSLLCLDGDQGGVVWHETDADIATPAFASFSALVAEAEIIEDPL